MHKELLTRFNQIKTGGLMRKLLLTIAAVLVSVTMASVSASATIYHFTATSAASGVLGYLELDSSVLNGTSFQYVDNSDLLAVSFVNPVTSFAVSSIGPTGQGTFFDSTGLPTVVG